MAMPDVQASLNDVAGSPPVSPTILPADLRLDTGRWPNGPQSPGLAGETRLAFHMTPRYHFALRSVPIPAFRPFGDPEFRADSPVHFSF